jgi:hypothetical protein
MPERKKGLAATLDLAGFDPNETIEAYALHSANESETLELDNTVAWQKAEDAIET